jgi:invasion protein IalB
MMKLFSLKTLSSAACALLLTAGAALAQAGAEAGATPGSPEVNRVADWMVRCFPVQSPSPCDMFQEQDAQNGQRVLSLSMAFVPSMNRHAIQISVPLDISIPKGLVVQTDSYTSPVLKYRRCDRSGCYVEMAIENGLVEALAKSGDKGMIKIFADNGKGYTLNFSLKGFSAAHDDMVAKARAKAKPVQQAAAAPAAAAPATP